MMRPTLVLMVALTHHAPAAYASDAKLPAGLDVAAISSLARSVLLDNIPERIEEQQDWGKQANRPGLDFKGQGFKSRLAKTEKPVNHGLWKQYRIEPVDPKNQLKLSVENLRVLEGGGFAFHLRVSAPTFASATVHQWVWGVRTLAATFEADAQATAVLVCEVHTALQPGTLLPSVVLAPKVVASHVDLDEFRLRKIGELPRSLAKEFSDEAKRIALRHIHKQEATIAEKANKALEKRSKAGKLTFAPIPFLK